jgi:hypothetical protein
MRRRWTPRCLLVVVVCCASGLFGPPAAAGSSPPEPYDFNGDGYADLPIGVPGDRAGGKDGAGAVNVLYASRGGLRTRGAQLWSQASRGIKGTPTTYESFGDVLASGDFDCDGRSDLAVGNNTKLAVLYGSRRGLTSRDQLVNAGLGVFEGTADQVEHLAAGDFDRDGCSELAVSGWGHLAVHRGTSKGLRHAARVSLPAAVADPGANLGQGLAAGDLTGDGIDDLVTAGASLTTAQGVFGGVAVIPGSALGLRASRAVRYGEEDPGIRQAGGPFFSHVFGASLAIGDFNGDRRQDLAIGDGRAGREEGVDDMLGDPLYCPGFMVCSGVVVVLRGTSAGLSGSNAEVLTKITMGNPRQAGFGMALAAGDVGGDGLDDLVVHEQWDVVVLRGSRAGLTTVGRQRWHLESSGVKGRTADDEFGSFGCGGIRLLDHGRGRGLDLSVGSPHQKELSGAVFILFGSGRGITASGDQLWRQSSRGVPGAAAGGDQFGGSSSCYVDAG